VKHHQAKRRPAPSSLVPTSVGPAPLEPQWARWLIGLLLAALTAALAHRTETSLDLGFHLRSGAFILEHGWPDKDTFTYTLNHRDYLDSQWLFQVVATALEGAGGLAALGVFRVVLLLVTLGLVSVSVAQREVSWSVAGVVGTLAIFTAEMRFYTRPESISFVLLAALLLVLNRGKRWWLLPPIMLVWTNSHSLFAVGLVILAARVAVEALMALRGGRLDRSLLKWALASVAVCFLNPYGFRGFVFPLGLWSRLSSDQLLNQSIAEFESPFSVMMTEGRQVPWWPLGCFVVLLAVVVVGIVVRRREVKAFELLVLAATGFLAAKAIRNLPLFAIAAAPSAAWGLMAMKLHRWEPLGQRRLLGRIAVLVGLVAATGHVVCDGYYIGMRRPERFGSELSDQVYPVKAVSALREQPLVGNMYNHLNFGGYLMWQLPERPVFIDGRTEVVGDEFFKQYMYLKTDEAGWRSATERWDFRIAVLPPDIDRKMADRLARDPAWRLLALDGVAAIFARDGRPRVLEPVPEGLATMRRQVLGVPLPSKAPLEGWVYRQRFPSQPFRMGVSWLILGDLDRAEYWLLKAAREGPRYFEMWHNLGLVYGRRKDMASARTCFERVLTLDPGNEAATERLKRLGSSPLDWPANGAPSP
jgi:hypothetical protein